MVGTKKRKLTIEFESSANLAQYVATQTRRYLEDHGAKNIAITLE